MKKAFLLSAIVLVLFLAACSDPKEDKAENNQKQDQKTETQAKEKTNSNEEAADEVDNLVLQLQKQDEEAGVTVESNSIYSILDEAIKADPQMGVPNDFSLYPFDISINPDGSHSIIFLAINRLKDPIKNVSFNMTFGNKNGEYIWEDSETSLPEKQFGVIQPDHAVPYMLDVTPEQEKIFDGLTNDNVYLKVNNFNMDVVE
ncbi:hypothetical protein [Lentibacillus sp. Marseille-P4043]|uniref:hypothetical protein n=1 Tax=Lentibacillus sp. Marseille-P4043 TaxID=2040293 RepID=UPI000D0B5680|nr:hypothetical protein [Lentibacillus sp. Marseille-P4043]